MKLIKLINIFLILVAVVLVVNLIRPLTSFTGNVAYSPDSSSTECIFVNNGETHSIAMENCCYELQRMLNCNPTTESLDLRCFVAENSPRYYLVNYEVINHCENEGYDVPET